MGKEGLKFAFKMIEHEFDRLESEKQKLENQNYKLRKGWILKSYWLDVRTVQYGTSYTAENCILLDP